MKLENYSIFDVFVLLCRSKYMREVSAEIAVNMCIPRKNIFFEDHPLRQNVKASESTGTR